MKGRQQGMAIIMALLIVALAATAASTVLWQQSLWWRQADNDKARGDSRLVADAGLDWAGDILAYDARTSNIDHESELWAQPLPATEAEGITITGQLQDAQARFNLQNLLQGGQIDEDALKLYRRLLTTLSLPDTLAYTLADWLDSDDETREGGAELAWYQALPKPYGIPAASRFRQTGQLRWVKGYDNAVLAKLLPHVVVLPKRTAINVNAVAQPLLRAIVPGLTPGQAQVLLSQRRQRYFVDIADFQRFLPQQPPSNIELAVNSEYFLLTSEIRHPRSVLRVDALLQRSGQLSTVLWRQEGVMPVTPAVNGDT